MVAANVAVGFVCTASALGLAFTALTSTVDGTLAWITAFLVPAVSASGALLLFRWRHRLPGLVWTLLPLACLVILVIMDIGTRDASAGTQILFFLSVLYAGSQLRPAAAYATALATTISEAVVVFSLEDASRATTDASYVTGVVLAMTWLLVTGAERQERLVGQLRRQADVDALTGLASRRVLVEAVRTALTTATRRGTAFLLVDVDEFKAVNDTYGHLVGDETLVHLGTILRDGFDADGIVCRLGGDELAVLLPDCAHAEALHRAERLVETVRCTPVPGVGDTGLAFSISVGVGHVPGGHEDSAELYSRADVSLYEAKRSGRGRVGRVAAPGPAVLPAPRGPDDARRTAAGPVRAADGGGPDGS